MNCILNQFLVSNRKGDNLQSYHAVEFESDMYRGVTVMRARCYPLNMDQHRFRGKNVKVCPYNQH
jgi:hypothetical protein